MILAKWTIAFYLEKEMNYIFIFLAAQDPKLNTVIQNISARTEISGNGSKIARSFLCQAKTEIDIKNDLLQQTRGVDYK